MFCKVCKDAKKSESVYTSHSVSVGGKVVCPTLLSQECKYCKEKGHTPKHCPKLKSKYNSTISNVKITFKSTPTASQEAQRQFQHHARELCSSPPPAPIGKKTKNYFQLLKVDEETGEETSVTATFKDNYFDIAKERVETFKREWVNTKDAEIETYKKNLEKNFPALGEEKTMKIVDAVFTTTDQSYSNKTATATSPVRARNEREDSPTPSPVSSRPHSPSPAPKKMAQVKEEEEDIKCVKRIPGVYGCSKCYPDCPSPSSSPPPDCIGTPSLSPTPPPPPPPTTTWTSWADVE